MWVTVPLNPDTRAVMAPRQLSALPGAEAGRKNKDPKRLGESGSQRLNPGTDVALEMQRKESIL